MNMLHLSFKTEPEDSSAIEILDRILDKGIVLEPWARVVSASTDFRAAENRIVVAPERRHKPFLMPGKSLRQN